MLVLKRVRVGSAFKVGLVLSGLMTLVFGLIAFLLQFAFISAIVNSTSFQSYPPGQAQSSIEAMRAVSLVGTGTLCFFYAMSVVFGAIFGGISFAIVAFFYNLTARWVGGLEIETFQSNGGGLLDEIEAEMYDKRKRG